MLFCWPVRNYNARGFERHRRIFFSSSLWTKVSNVSSRNKKWFPTGTENEQTNLQRAGAESRSYFQKENKTKEKQTISICSWNAVEML